MKRLRLWIGAAALLPVMGLALAAGAQSASGFDLSWHAMASGGGRTASASFAMHTTVGQTSAGDTYGSGHAALGGYWQNWLQVHTFMPLVARDAAD